MTRIWKRHATICLHLIIINSVDFMRGCERLCVTEMSIGLNFELDWTDRTVTIFVEFRLDPVCKSRHKFSIRTGFGLG